MISLRRRPERPPLASRLSPPYAPRFARPRRCGFFRRSVRARALSGFVLTVMLATGCAVRAPQSGTALANGQGPEVDAVLPAGDGWRIFQLGARRQAVIAAHPDAWDQGVPRAPVWKTLAAPAGVFRPVQAVPGQRGYFYLVDAASARLCLYDAEASLLSTYPLPSGFTPFPAGRAEVFRGADGAFTFVDYGSAEARQYVDRQTFEAGATRWVPRGSVKLPAGVQGCAQPPGSTDLFCDAGGAPLRFDGALNRVAPRPSGGPAEAAHAREDGAGGSGGGSGGLIAPRWNGAEWIFEGRMPAAQRGRPGSVLFRYRGLEKNWERLDATGRDPDTAAFR